MDTPSSFAALIELWPSVAEFARETEQPYERVKQWRANDSIPAPHWPSVLSAAKRLGVPGLNATVFMDWAAARSREGRRAAEGCA